MASTIVEYDGTEHYIVFEVNHFTQFVIGKEDCSFVINNDDASTTSIDVTAYSVCKAEIQSMILANSESDLMIAIDKKSRESYNPAALWTLESTPNP